METLILNFNALPSLIPPVWQDSESWIKFIYLSEHACLIATKIKTSIYATFEHVTERKDLCNVGSSALLLSTILEIIQESVTVCS